MSAAVAASGRERWLPAIAAVFVTSLIISNIIAEYIRNREHNGSGRKEHRAEGEQLDGNDV